MWFGVDEYFLFTYQEDFEENQEHLVDPTLISMPCFHEGVFWIEMKEKDDFVNEESQSMLACKNF